jgi:N-acyl homoserine lactone hydrolase
MKLYLFQLGIGRETGSPVPGYLIQTDDGTNILVDTGFPRNLEGLGEGARDRWDVAESDYVVEQLARLGLRPRDIRYVVSTHLDIDHAGGHDDFPDAEHVIQRAHYEAGKHGLERLQVLRPRWDHPSLRYRLVDGDTELVPGVELIETSGHVPGHQAVLVRLPETGPVLLAIDAIPRAAQLDPDTRPIGPYDADAAGVRASTRKLVDLARREGVTLIVHGHDPDQWRTLRKSPEYYS